MQFKKKKPYNYNFTQGHTVCKEKKWKKLNIHLVTNI